MEVTYEQIKPLIKKEELNGQQMSVEFQAEGQSTPIQAVGMMEPDQSQVVKNVGKSAVKRGVVSAFISGISRLVGGAVGGVGGSVASSATSQMGHTAANNQMKSDDVIKVKDTPENRQKAVLGAFKSVESMFQWDESTKTWSFKQPAPSPQS